jgi:hypothetical protein
MAPSRCTWNKVAPSRCAWNKVAPSRCAWNKHTRSPGDCPGGQGNHALGSDAGPKRAAPRGGRGASTPSSRGARSARSGSRRCRCTARRPSRGRCGAAGSPSRGRRASWPAYPGARHLARLLIEIRRTSIHEPGRAGRDGQNSRRQYELAHHVRPPRHDLFNCPSRRSSCPLVGCQPDKDVQEEGDHDEEEEQQAEHVTLARKFRDHRSTPGPRVAPLPTAQSRFERRTGERSLKRKLPELKLLLQHLLLPPLESLALRVGLAPHL